MDQASADQLANGPLSGVLGITALWVGVKDKDQLVGRQPGRVFVEEERQDGALGLSVLRCRGARIARTAIPRVLVSHEEK
jgi:hypothetical protein